MWMSIERPILTVAPDDAFDVGSLGHPWPSDVVATTQQYYQRLWAGSAQPSTVLDQQAEQYVEQQLAHTAGLDLAEDALPDDVVQLSAWMAAQQARVGAQFQDYLSQRAQGAPRRLLPNRATAMLWLRELAPTKLVDGAWLSGLLAHWQDPRAQGLIRTYLDELGNGVAADHHVLIYRQLLQQLGLSTQASHDDAYVQGTLQLALGRCADRYLPEILGFHLGYEQLPLHLLVSHHELTELGLDAAYFRLHITIDNADSGHAQQAVQAIEQAMPVLGDRQGFYQRIKRGYQLNWAGVGAVHMANRINLDDEIVALLARKGRVGQYAHADHCMLAGRSIRAWLADPQDAANLRDTLSAQGWVKRHQPPAHSRFWQMITGSAAPMFGVFSGAEQQLWHDWLAGDALDHLSAQSTADRCYFPPAQGGHRVPSAHLAMRPRLTPAQHSPVDEPSVDAWRQEAQQLAQHVAQQATLAGQMQALLPFLSPQYNGHAVGLAAAPLFLAGLSP
jgi:hypothetical protein